MDHSGADDVHVVLAAAAVITSFIHVKNCCPPFERERAAKLKPVDLSTFVVVAPS